MSFPRFSRGLLVFLGPIRPFRRTLARFPIEWNHSIDKNSRQIERPEQVLIEKARRLFRNLLWPILAAK